MTDAPLLLRRIDPVRNMARFYGLAIEPTLFGGAALVRDWGRIGTRGRRKVELYADPGHAALALERLALAKTRRGYRPR
jgi:predicted DNA-binding WGR domain protein